ncbi:hypothetical protein RN001_003001 [Aquatica leii]|uniref:Mutator-like transposase domain-containing protein n=1 Tax=Aquatica leii TaxID=1421715 RepID=A0AAN7QBD5_9COLE|nr:hypothetical protein RN001_003001 [Aquatica leii]
MSDASKSQQKKYRKRSVKLKMKRLRSNIGTKRTDAPQLVEAMPAVNTPTTSAAYYLPDNFTLCNPSTSTELEKSSTDLEEVEMEQVLPELQQTEKPDRHVTGRRFFDIEDFIEELRKANSHHPFTCNFNDMDLISESRDCLISFLNFKCRMCNIEKIVRTETGDDKLTANSAIVLSTITNGMGFSQMAQHLSIMNMPQLSRRQFEKHFEQVSETILATSWESMEEAGIEEARIAQENGDVDAEGYPLITPVPTESCKTFFKLQKKK